MITVNSQIAVANTEAKFLVAVLHPDDTETVGPANAALMASAPALVAAVERVQALHTPDEFGMCEGCGDNEHGYAIVPHPCPTIRALGDGMSEKKFAHEVVPAIDVRDYCMPDASTDGYAAKAATYHAARAQGFFRATLEGVINPEVISNLMNEYHLAALYFGLATTDSNDIDSIGVGIAERLQYDPEGVGEYIWEILTWADIDPETIAAYVPKPTEVSS